MARKDEEVTGHFALVYPSEYIKAADLHGRDITVVIAGAAMTDLVMEGGKRDRKIALRLKGPNGRPLSKRWVAGKTVLKQIAASVGDPIVANWKGKSVTIYPTTCRGKGGETMECIRVRMRASAVTADLPEDMTAEPAPRSFADEVDGDAPPDAREPGAGG